MYRLPKETTADDLLFDLKLFNIKLEPHQIDQKSRDNAPFKSFRIKVPQDLLQKITDIDIWPSGVMIRDYVFYPKRRDNPNPAPSPKTRKQSTATAHAAPTWTGPRLDNRLSVLSNLQV